VAQNQPSTSDLIHALLAEYDTCYKTRDHYDRVVWTIGSIFIGCNLLFVPLHTSAKEGRNDKKCSTNVPEKEVP
jgi:hypothetical protein